jgi:putative peptide zinc metalloprotease protein
MNLSEALDAALPEIPQVRLTRSRPPRIDPDLIVHEDILDGEPTIGILQRDKANYFRFQPWQWQLAQLFDGERSYEEIATAFEAESGMQVQAEDVRSFSEQMDACDFWYKTHQEKNLAMREKLLAQRGRRAKSKINVAHISFSAWDPDRYLGWVNRKAGKFIYSGWCALAAVLLFVFETIVVIQNWKFIGPDTALFFNFAQKSFADFAEFWLLILVIGFIHETAHGLTCKHFGGQVHSMGLMFLYFVPCFFVDVTESWVSATKIQRLGTIIAGIWIELTVCGIAIIFWLNSAEGGWAHNLAYEVILLTGIAAVAINLNPLIKLDGYYFLTEVIEIPELKERSTAFMSAWFQAKILRMPVEVPVVPRRRVALFAAYAIASGAYSYLLLFFVVRLSYRLGSKWFSEFALIPSALLTFFLFRSRLRALRRVLLNAWNRTDGSVMQIGIKNAAAGLALIAFLFVPLWRDCEDGYYVIEPDQSQAICAAVAGRVEQVMVREGQQVRAGEPLLKMTSDESESMSSGALAQTKSAQFRTFNAQIKGESGGTGVADQFAAGRMTQLANEAQTSLLVAAPADGTIVTKNPSTLVDQDVGSGEPLLQLAAGVREARIFVPTSALSRISANSELVLALPGQFEFMRLKLTRPAGDPLPLPPGLIPAEKYQGFKEPVFYSSRVTLPAASGNPMYGMSGQAKIFGKRRSLAGRAAMAVSDLARSHIW